MTHQTEQRYSIGRKLAGQLDLDPDQPVIEWHSWRQATIAPPDPITFTPVPFNSTGWRYLLVSEAETTNRSAPGYDDSSWPVGAGAFGSGIHSTHAAVWSADGCLSPTIGTATGVNTGLWLRRHVAVDPGTPLRVGVRLDGSGQTALGVGVYWNGVAIGGPNHTRPIELQEWLIPGDQVLADNVLAVYGVDESTDDVGDYFVLDAQVVRDTDTPTRSPYKAALTALNPTAHWRLDEPSGTTAYDTARGTYPATQTGTVTRGVTGQSADGRKAAQFPGTSGGYFTATGMTTWTAAAFTVVATLTPTVSDGERPVLARSSSSVADWDFGLGYGAVRLRICNTAWREVTAPVTLGAVNHVVGTYDGSGTLRIYVNGVLKNTLTGAGSRTKTGSCAHTIGALAAGYPNTSYRYGGTAQDLAILYGRVLTATEVADLYATLDDAPRAQLAAPPPPEPVTTTGWALDPDRTAALTSYRVDYARQAVTERTGPLSCSAQLTAPWIGTLPTVGELFRLTISDAVAAALGLAADDRPRFTGQVTDADVDDRGVVQVVGVGTRARLGRVDVGGDKRWPVELDGKRVARVLTAVAEKLPQLDVGQLDDGTVQLLQREPAAATADSIVDEIVASSNGQLVEQRNGQLDWHSRDHRRGAVVALTLDAQLLRPFRWAQGIGSVINRARVAWGADQAQVVVEHAGSADQVTGLGPIEADVGTQLANEADAYATGSDLVGRRAWPTWQLPSCTVELVRSVPAGPLRGQLLALRHGALIHLAQLPPGGPYTAADAWVEGTEETCTRTSWSLTLHVSDYAQGGVSLRWVDIPEGVTWDQLRADLTWLDLATATPTDLT